MKRICLIIGLLFTVNALYGSVYQSTGQSLDVYRGDISVLENRVADKVNLRVDLERLVKLLFVTEDFASAEKYAAQYLSLFTSDEIQYLRAITLANLSRYHEASAVIDSLLAKGSLSKKERTELMRKRDLIKKGLHTVGEPSSGSQPDWGAKKRIIGSADESGIFIGVDTLGGKAFGITMSNGTVGKIPPLSALGDIDFTNSISLHISHDGRTVFITTTDGEKVSLHWRSMNIRDGKWSPWKTPSFALDGSINGFACMLDNGTDCIFISNRNTQSGCDIFSTKLTDGIWSEPIGIDGGNTDMDESSLTLAADGETVFFSSNGHPGSGGFDMYQGILSVRGGKISIEKIRQVDGINTYRNEVLPPIIAFNGSSAYTTINKNLSDSVWKMGYVSGIPACSYIIFTVIDGETKSPLQAEITLFRAGSEPGRIPQVSKTDFQGVSRFTVQKNSQYMISVSAEGYVYYTGSVDTSDIRDFITITIPLDKGKIKAGYTFTADNIYYDPASAEIKAESESGLERLFQFMKKNPGVHIEIAGHTDNTGSYEYNMDLSIRRAKAIAMYLEKHGISASRITVKGFGFEQNVMSNDTPEGRQKNRRVEITVLSAE